jgi:hypothetical protein
MNPELEALIPAYDAAKQATPDQVIQLRALYQQQLDQAAQRAPNLSRHTLEAMVRFAHRRWLKSQHLPSTLPPRA